MKFEGKHTRNIALLILSSALSATIAFAQGGMPGQQPQPGQPGQQPNPTNPANPSNPNSPPLTLDSTAPPVNAEEEAAIKAFRDEQDAAKRDQLADGFVQKYPQSRYLPEVYNWLVRSYYRRGDVDKMEATADKQLALFPNDPQTLAIVGGTLPRAWNTSMSEEQKQKRLEKAEKYCKKSLELLPTIPKPDGMTDEKFQQLKNETAAMANSGLGLAEFRRGKFADAIPHLEDAVKADPQAPDPVNYYVLGIADEKTSHFDAAVVAFTKCAAMQSGMKATCTQNVDEAKKLGATQLSSPK